MITKQKTVWYCSECGHKQAKWTGQCSQCNNWDTFNEEIDFENTASRFQVQRNHASKAVRLQDVSLSETPRIKSTIQEFDRLLGGGIVPGSFALVGGSPGIGKSTLLLQMASQLAVQGLTVLYVCGEESIEQTSLRAQRLKIDTNNLFLLNETNFSVIKQQIDQVNPHIIIVDSIQIIYKEELPSAPGSVSQVRETASEFMLLSKGKNISTFLIGHVTKSGEIAGPRVLEHLVDTVLYFEGDRHLNYRMLRTVKNRFGPSDEIAVFQMRDDGLAEVPNPSQLFLEERQKGSAGSTIIATIEGSRPILVEIQALVTDTAYSTPSRRCTGIELNRLVLILAVLEKRMGYHLYRSDVFVSVAGGIKIIETAGDLGILLAITSSFSNRNIPPTTIVMGEVGLGGEIRGIPRIEARIKEAIHMGFTRCIMPKRNINGITKDLTQNIELIGVERIEEAIATLR